MVEEILTPSFMVSIYLIILNRLLLFVRVLKHLSLRYVNSRAFSCYYQWHTSAAPTHCIPSNVQHTFLCRCTLPTAQDASLPVYQLNILKGILLSDTREKKQTKPTKRLSWHSQYFSCTESSVSQLKYCFSVLSISWLGHEKPGTRQPLSSLPLAYHRMYVCSLTLFSLCSCFMYFFSRLSRSSPCTVFVTLVLVLFLCVLLFCSQRKSFSKPLAELDHRNPAVHSEGPLLLLAVYRPTWWGSEREKEWVAGGGAQGQQGAQISQLLVHKLCPPCQRLSRSAGKQAHTQGQDKTADRKWIEMVLTGDSSCTQTTKPFMFFVGWRL